MNTTDFVERFFRISISNKQTSTLTLVYRSSRLIRAHRAPVDCATQQRTFERDSAFYLFRGDRPPRYVSPRNQLIISLICMKIDRKGTFLFFFFFFFLQTYALTLDPLVPSNIFIQYDFLPRQFYISTIASPLAALRNLVSRPRIFKMQLFGIPFSV